MVAWQLPDICWLDSVPWGNLGAFHWPMWAWNASGVQVSVSLQRLVLHRFIVPGRFQSAAKSS